MPPKYYDNDRIRSVTIALWYFTNLLITAGIVSALMSGTKRSSRPPT